MRTLLFPSNDWTTGLLLILVEGYKEIEKQVMVWERLGVIVGSVWVPIGERGSQRLLSR